MKILFCLLPVLVSLNLYSQTCVSLLKRIASTSPSYQARELQHVAQTSLEKNIVRLERGPYLSAGGHQFVSFWTRDFAWSSRGLMISGNGDVVKNQVETLVRLMNDEHLVPKVMDSMNPSKRVLLSGLKKAAHIPDVGLKMTDDILPHFLDENGSIAIDSNLLVIKAALEYVDFTGDIKWWRSFEDDFFNILHFYDKKFNNGLIYQEAFSDWQDSVKRVGATSYTNILYYVTAKRMQKLSPERIDDNLLRMMKEEIISQFYDPESGIFRSIAGMDYFGLDSNLLALDYRFLENQSDDLYHALRHTKFFEGLPGWNTFPNYPKNWKSLATTMAHLPYHDEVYWSWLMGYSGKIAQKYGDDLQARQILEALEQMMKRDGVVGEIYTHDDSHSLWECWCIRSETPFSWGASFILDMLYQMGF